MEASLRDLFLIWFYKEWVQSVFQKTSEKFSFTFRKPALEITTAAEILGPAIQKALKQDVSRTLDAFSHIFLKGIKLFKTIPIKNSAKIAVAILCLPFQQSAALKQNLLDANPCCRGAAWSTKLLSTLSTPFIPGYK